MTSEEQKVKEDPQFNPQSMNARDWVKEFNRIEVSEGLQPTDPRRMLGWFAKAIMAGYGEAIRRNEKSIQREARLEEALEKLARLGNEPNYGNSVGNVIAQQALTQEMNIAILETL